MSAKHTPGPWEVSKIHVEGLYGNNGEAFVIAEGRRICQVDCATKFKRGQGYLAQCAERDANTNLIAAAPELLDALYQYRNDLRHPPAPDSVERRLAMIDALIAKALGEQK